MWSCDNCELTFETFQAKANHVRWTHKPSAYTEDGLERLKESARATAIKRYGVKTIVNETRTCKCGVLFEVTYSPDRKGHVKKTCSKECAARREQTREMNERKSSSMKSAFIKNSEVCMRGIRAMQFSANSRCSSKAERALAEILVPLGFKRHKHITVEGLTFDVDIVSTDNRVWIESDGEWHFRQVHLHHDFEKTQLRDQLEEREAINRNVLLIRVNNQTTTVEEQVTYIQACIRSWDGTGKIQKLGF